MTIVSALANEGQILKVFSERVGRLDLLGYEIVMICHEYESEYGRISCVVVANQAGGAMTTLHLFL